MSNPSRKTGKGGQAKIGRSARKPSHQRYNNERRWEKNKERKAAKIAKDLKRKAVKKARNAAN